MDKELFQYKIAVATSDGIVVNQHFGRAMNFKIYGIRKDNTFKFCEERNVAPVCEGGNHDENRMKERVEALADCKYVLVSRIGGGAASALEQKGIIPMELPGIINESIDRLIVYAEIQNLLS